MKKYYIVENGDLVSTANYFGNFDSLSDAKEKAFDEMGSGDVLVGFNPDIDPECTDEYGYDTVDTDLADEDHTAELLKTDDSIEGVPEGLYYWSDDPETFYRKDGSIWG